MQAASATQPLEELVREHAALRRVATLVARAPSRSEVFSAVTEEAAVLLGASRSSLLRVRSPALAEVVAAWSDGTAPPIPVGHRGAIDGRGILGQMLQTRRPVTIEDFDVVGGAVADLMRQLGIRSGVGGPIILAGEVWGALNVTWPAGVPIPARAEERVAAFTELVAYAIENAENRYELAASRARLVEAADAARRRIERDLHDGAQQRLVSAALELAQLERQLEDDLDAARDTLARSREHLDTGLGELRDLARGIHPAVLTERGLGAAVTGLAQRYPAPVDLRIDLPARLEPAIEAAAYFVVSEALTNIAKYAEASAVEVDMAVSAERLIVRVCDDGVGGATSGKGSGLQGLVDRVEAVGGHLEIASRPGRGTTIRAVMPTRVLARLRPADQRVGPA
jgi:signal transduction histidine kinase